MQLFHDFAFVVNGKKRKDVVMLLVDPRTPSELSRLLKIHANVVTRVLKALAGRELVEAHEIKSRRRTYRLTKRGELARQVLDYLSEPRGFPDVLKHFRTHRNVVASIVKHFVSAGFITLFKNLRPARKFYQLTKRGDAVREKLE